MQKSVVISIPVPKHVKQFMLAEFGPEEPLRVHQNQFLGNAVKLVLIKNPFRQNRKKLDPNQKHAPRKQEHVKIVLPTALKHFTISEERLQHLGQFLQKFFTQQMYQFIKGAVHYTQNETDAVRSFCRVYNIDPDSYDDETARKAWRDYKNKVFEANTSLTELAETDS